MSNETFIELLSQCALCIYVISFCFEVRGDFSNLEMEKSSPRYSLKKTGQGHGQSLQYLCEFSPEGVEIFFIWLSQFLRKDLEV